MSHARGTLFALVVLSTAMVCLGDSRALSSVVSQEQSYFFGTKPANNLLCYTKTISKTSALPATVTYTNGNTKNINFVTMNADRYSSLGYTVDLTSGQLGTTAISYKLNGPSILPYAIIVNMYCDP